jgi:endonuclease YncB( thermonuclease family)
MMVQTEGIVTQLVFDHALRIRMKEETSSKTSQPPTTINTPDTQSIIDGDTPELEDEAENSGDSSEETLRANSDVSRTSSTPTSQKKQKAREVNLPAIATTPVPIDEKSNNLVGRINNFITTDLGNVVDGRDFLWMGKSCWFV